jgi:hypothetical protein
MISNGFKETYSSHRVRYNPIIDHYMKFWSQKRGSEKNSVEFTVSTSQGPSPLIGWFGLEGKKSRCE